MLSRGRVLGAVGVTVSLRAQHLYVQPHLVQLASSKAPKMMTSNRIQSHDIDTLEEQERMAAAYSSDSDAGSASDEDALFGDKGLPSVASERFLANGQDVRVCSSEGTRTMARMKALIDLPASEVYALLANADNSKVIRSINSVRKHKVLSDKGDVQAARAQHDICGGPKIARLEFTLDINFTFFPETYSGEFELDSPAGMRLYKGKFRAADVETSGNKVLSVSKHGAGQPCASIDANELYNDDLPVADASSSSGATSGQCLLWVQQEIEPDVPQKLPPRTVRGVLRRASRKEMSQFVDDIQIVAQLRNAGVPLEQILTSKIRGRGGLIRKIEGQQKKENKQMRKLEKQERKLRRKEGKPEPKAPLPPHLAGASADTGTFRTFAVEV